MEDKKLGTKEDSNINRKKKLMSKNAKFNILLGIVVFMSVFFIFAPYIAPHDPYETNLLNTLQAPSREYLFGTDSLGRCIFSRVLCGGSKSIFSALIVVLATSVIGSIVGIISGYFNSKIDAFVMGIVDVFLAFPGMIIAIVIAGILGGGLKNAMISIGLISWTKYARLVRSEVLSIKEETYIKAARLSGRKDIYIILNHVIPNVFSTVIITASLDIGVIIMEIAGLSFLGLSSPLPMPEWGSMINEGRSMIQYAPWISIFPGIAILIVVVLFNLLGDSAYEMTFNKQRRK